MQPAQAAGMTKSLNSPAMPSTSIACTGSWIVVNTKIEADAPTKPIDRDDPPRQCDAAGHARDARDERRRDEAADAAEQQRQAGEERAHL